MLPTIPLSVPYEFDFAVLASPSPLWSSRSAVFIAIELQGEASDSALRAYTALVATFVSLANTGALCGGQIAPPLSRIHSHDLSSRTATQLVFTLSGCLVDERSTAVCANALSLGHA